MPPERWARQAGVGAFISTREGGFSRPPWDSLNLGVAVGDDPLSVQRNRALFAEQLGATPVFLRQVHGTQVVELKPEDALRPVPIEADAAWTTATGLACTVQVADCLPVLFADRQARVVGAAHAGWRGLAGGVLERTIAALCTAAGCQPSALTAWLGPCIGPGEFEVGADVVQAFGGEPGRRENAHFVQRARPDGDMRWLADLPALAQARLHEAGVAAVARDGRCTVSDASRFFSFRRDGVTGRMAAAVWRRG